MSKDEEDDESALEQERIGYGHPPKRSQFKRGRSPNPRGRPKGAGGRAKIVHGVAFETHAIIENGKQVRRTTIELVLLSLRNHAAAANARAARVYESYLERYGVQEAIRPTGYLVLPERLTPAEFESKLAEERNNHHERLERLKAEHEVRLAAWKAENGS